MVAMRSDCLGPLLKGQAAALHGSDELFRDREPQRRVEPGKAAGVEQLGLAEVAESIAADREFRPVKNVDTDVIGGQCRKAEDE